MNTRHLNNRLRDGARAGMTVVELVIASGIIAVVLIASAAAMSQSVEATEMSKRMMRGASFLESVQEDLSTLQANNLLAMNGQLVYSHEDWDTARFRVEISVFNAAIDLLQIKLALVDQVRDETLATIHTLRSDA